MWSVNSNNGGLSIVMVGCGVWSVSSNGGLCCGVRFASSNGGLWYVVCQ